MIKEYNTWRKGIDVSFYADQKTHNKIEESLKRGFKAGWQKCAQKKSTKQA